MFFHFKRNRAQKAERKPPRFLILKRKWLTLAAAGLAAAAIFAAVNYPAAVSASTATRQLPIYCVQRDQKVCSISFDAAWGADNTQKILDVLSEYGVACTFFVVGNWADQYPEQAKAIVESGNELMNHSNAHDHFNTLSADAIIADVNTCNDKIEALTGVRPTLIRCPFGEYDDHVISAAVEAIASCDMLIVGGTSLVVYPAAGLIRYFGGDDLVIVNREPTPQDAMADLVCACDIAAAFDF